MQKPYITITLIFSTFYLLAQPKIAPDFTAKDINGVEYHLYDLLAEGKPVVIDFSATWCGPCWTYKQSHVLEDFYEQKGPDGTDEAMAFFVECDITTTLDDLKGLTNGTAGDWITGVNHPIIDNSGIAAAYGIGSYPTIYMICPDLSVIPARTSSAAQLVDILGQCASIEVAPESSFYSDKYEGCGDLDVAFFDTSWPRANSWEWDFGDGSTSLDQNPTHNYTSVGDFDVKLTATNEFGENTVTRNSVISVGQGDTKPNQKIGPASKTIGTGRYFEGGHQGLIFNAKKDIVISSVKVFSEQEGMRTLSVIDKNGNNIYWTDFYIPKGESRLEVNFSIPQGDSYRLGLKSDAFLYRNDSGAKYPYNVDDVLTITTSTANQDPLKYYYYFYDWDVRESGCLGASGVDDLTSAITMYPNPVSNVLTLEGISGKVSVFNALGTQIWNQDVNSTNAKFEINVSSYSNGVYFIVNDNTVAKFIKK